MQSARTEQESHWHVMTGSHVMLSRTTFLYVTAGVYSVGAGCQSVRAKTLADGPTWAAIRPTAKQYQRTGPAAWAQPVYYFVHVTSSNALIKVT